MRRVVAEQSPRLRCLDRACLLCRDKTGLFECGQCGCGPTPIKTTEDFIYPPSPGFRETLIIYMFHRNNIFQSYFDTLSLHLRLVRALQIAGGNQECFIHKACYSLQIGLPQVLNRCLHLDFEVLQWSKLDEIGVHKIQRKQPPTECLHFTCGQLQLLTSNYSQRN